MNERRVFCTNAETMGQSTSPPSTPRGPPPSAQFEQHQQQKQEEKYEQQSRVQDANQTVQQPKQLTKDEQQPSQSPKPPQSVENELPYLCSQFAATNLAVGGCETTVEQHKHNSRSTPITTEHYRNQLQKLRSICGHAAIMNFELNNIFLKRLEEIDCLDEQCGGDSVGIGEGCYIEYYSYNLLEELLQRETDFLTAPTIEYIVTAASGHISRLGRSAAACELHYLWQYVRHGGGGLREDHELFSVGAR